MRILHAAALAVGLFATALPAATPKPPAKAPATGSARAPAKPAARPKPAATTPATLPDSPEIRELRAAFRFAFPLYEMMRTRGLQLARAEEAGFPAAVNAILPKLTLADATTREVTTPNNDTLYGSAWLDLSQGPVILTMPPLPNRYHSASLMSLQTDVVGLFGTRTGGKGGRYAIVGPDYSGITPEGTELVRSPTNDAWLLIRVLVNDDRDLAAASNALTSFGMRGPRAGTPPLMAAPPVAPDAATFLAVVNDAIARSGSPALKTRAAAFGALGLTTKWDNVIQEKRSLWAKSLPALRAELRSGLSDPKSVVQGWSYPPFDIAQYGDNDDLRAAVALGGLAALPRVEALYLTARTDAAGATLEGSKSYRVKMPANMPVGSFWSLTMYQVEPDGRLFFVPNELNRFALGDRSRFMHAERDGSYEIFVQGPKPSGERVVNWLPAPKGKFVLIYRAQLPRAEFLDGSFRLPPVTTDELIP